MRYFILFIVIMDVFPVFKMWVQKIIAFQTLSPSDIDSGCCILLQIKID